MMIYPLIATPVDGGEPWQYTIAGTLADTIECTVRQEYNTGLYELTMQYKQDGVFADLLVSGNYIVARPDKSGTAQPFRIERIRRTINGSVSLTANHISYLHASEIVMPFLNGGVRWTAAEAWQHAVDAIANPIGGAKTCTIDSASYGAFAIHALKPVAFKTFLLEQLIPAYGGAIVLDGMDVTWETETNPNRHVRLQGGVDITALSTDADVSQIETAIIPYYGDATGSNGFVAGEIVNYGIDLPYRVIPVDFTSKFETAPTEEQLQAAADAYKTKRVSEIQPVKITVDSIPRRETILPGDTVTIYVRQLGMDVQRVVTAIVYDVLRDAVTAVEVGSQKSTLAKIIASLR